jgi:hypothetical protein
MPILHRLDNLRKRVSLTARRKANWASWRDFVVDKVVQESESARSFHLVPADGGKFAPYLPEQYLTMRLAIRSLAKPIIRCYTLSEPFNGLRYRLTIKRQGRPPERPDLPAGVSSTYFHDHVRAGDVLQAKMPKGQFFRNPAAIHPAALIAGGTGITPMINMLNAVSQAIHRRDVYLLFGLRHGGDHVFREHLRELRARHTNLHIRILYEDPRREDRPRTDFDATGRIDASLLKPLTEDGQMEYFVCGPPGMMQIVTAELLNRGVEERRIRTESFGPSSLSFRAAMAEAEQEQAPEQREIRVTFLRTGITVPWTGSSGTLLEFAEAHGVYMDYGCRYGDCATCLTSLVSGKVAYLHPVGATPDPGACLPCSCRPLTSVVLDA